MPRSAPQRRVAGLGAPGTPAEALAAIRGSRKPATRKYKNVPVEIEGRRFDSKREGDRYRVLRLLEQAGEISGLECHPSWTFVVNGTKVARYTADFSYRDAGGRLVVEDVKSRPTKTRDYVIRKKLLLALYGISVTEVA